MLWRPQVSFAQHDIPKLPKSRKSKPHERHINVLFLIKKVKCILCFVWDFMVKKIYLHDHVWASSAPLSIFLYQKFWLVSKFTWLLLGSVLNHGKSHTVLWSDFLYCRQLITYADNINSKTALRTLRGCIDTLNTCFRNDDKVRERTRLLLLIASKKQVY